jgi:hypothetical protein
MSTEVQSRRRRLADPAPRAQTALRGAEPGPDSQLSTNAERWSPLAQSACELIRTKLPLAQSRVRTHQNKTVAATRELSER